MERALDAELEDHLGYSPHERKGTPNSRNGRTKKTVKTDSSALEIEVPRDRDGSFEPQLVKKRQRRLAGFDEKVLAFYARGMSTREIQAQLEEIYDIEVSPTLISNVTHAVLDEVKAWQSRPLSSVYPILYFDVIFVKSRRDGPVKNKAVYLALGVNLDGEKELLGLWMSESEGSAFWLTVFNELNNRGVEDCFVACVDGLKDLPEAIESVFPRAQVQLCIVHKIRNSLKYVAWKERKAVAKHLRAIYGAATLVEAQGALERLPERCLPGRSSVSRHEPIIGQLEILFASDLLTTRGDFDGQSPEPLPGFTWYRKVTAAPTTAKVATIPSVAISPR